MKGLEQHLGIESRGKIPYIVEIVGELLESVFQIRPVGIIHLSPTRDPRADQMTEVVVGDLLIILLHQFDPLCPRSDHAHVSPQHIPKLGQLIQACLPEKTSDACHPAITLSCVALALVAADLHCAELEEGEEFSVETDPLL